MSEDVLEAVLDELPAPAARVSEALNLSHEDTYGALVTLENRGLAVIYVGTPHRGRRAIHWEAT